MPISTFDSPRTGVLSPMAGQENPPANLPRPRVVPWWLVGCCPRRGRIQASGEWTSRFTFAGASSAIIDQQLQSTASGCPSATTDRKKTGDLNLALFQNIMKISRQSHSCGQTATNRHPTSHPCPKQERGLLCTVYGEFGLSLRIADGVK